MKYFCRTAGAKRRNGREHLGHGMYQAPEECHCGKCVIGKSTAKGKLVVLKGLWTVVNTSSCIDLIYSMLYCSDSWIENSCRNVHCRNFVVRY